MAGGEVEPGAIIISLVILYALLSIADGSVDFLLRRVGCKTKVNAYLAERNIRRRDEHGNMVNKQYTIASYSYNGKQYEYKGHITSGTTKGANSQGKSVSLLIDKHCPYYINGAGIQGNMNSVLMRNSILK